MLPLSLLKTAQGHPMLVELKNGETYNGHLVNCDTWMNIHLREVICTSKDGDRFWRMPECYIRGNTIKYLRVPDEVIDKVQEETKNRADRKPPGAGGRGRGRGREDGTSGRPAKGMGRGVDDGIAKGVGGGRGRGGPGGRTGPVYWPMFVVAVLAAIIASQALISGTFSIIQQSLSLGCFPRVKVVHTSAKYEGQVFIPEVNYLLMVACVAVTLGFRTTAKIGNAYGIMVMFVMTLTSLFLVLIMIMIWKTHILLVISYVLVIGTVELLYLSSVLYKFNQGGYLPLAFAMVLMAIMYTWNYVYRKKYYYELDHKISPEKLKEIAADTNLCRIPGLAVFYSELVHGIPPIFKHYAANIPALHSVLVFVSIKSLPISKVPINERFLFRRVYPNDLNVFRCVVRYGYTDVRNEEEPFDRLLVERLKDFIREDFMISSMVCHSRERLEKVEKNEGGDCVNEEKNCDQVEIEKHQQKLQEAMEGEIEVVDKAWRAGLVHLVGEHEVVAEKGANFGKRILINYAYHFLKNNLRQSINKAFDIPQKRMLKVGMTYEL